MPNIFKGWADLDRDLKKQNITVESLTKKETAQQNNKWYAGDTPTWRESIGRAYQIAEMDRDRGQKAYNDLQYLKNDPNSRYYRYYASATNGAIKELENLGFDTRLLQQEGFFSDPATASFINNNLERSGTTNSPKSPTKKTSTNGRISYWLTQYQAAMEDTQNAKTEVEKITNKAKTLAGWKDRNYSDDEIMNIIYGKDGEQFRKDYPTLYRMQNRANEFKPVELNEAVDFTQDLLYGATWLGRNPEYDGKYDLEQAMAMSYMGKGDVWKEDPVISAKLNPESNSFAPYSVGRTGLGDAALHFGTDRFDNNWLSANQHLVFDGTDEDKKYYNQVLAGKENYDAATTAINALNLWADKYKNSTDYDTIKKDFDTMLAKGYIIIGTGKNEGKVFTKDVSNSQRVDLSILNKMDKSMGKGDLSPTESDKYGTGDLIPMMDSVDYKYSQFLDKMSGQVDYNRHKRVGYDTLAGLDLTKNPEAEREKYPFELIDETKTKKVSRVLDIVEEKLSPKEKQHFAALPNANGMKLAEAFAKAKEGVLMDGPVNTKLLTDPVWLAQMATKQVEKAENDYMATSLQSLQLRNEFEKTEKETETIQSKIDDLNSEYGDAVLASQNVPEDMTVDIDGLPGMQVTFTQDKNGKYNLSSEFDLDSPFMNNYLASNGISKEEFKKKVNETEQRVNNYADSVREAKKQYENGRVHELEDMDSGVKLEIPYVPDGQGGYTLSPEFNSQSEEVKRYMEASGTTENELWKEINDYMNQLNDGISAYQQQMNALTARLDANSIYLKNNREAYDEAAVAVDRANQRRMRQGDLALRNSGMTIDPAMSDAVLNIVAGFTGYENPQDGYDSLVETLQQHYGMRTFTGEDLKELDGYIAELNSQAELYRTIVKNYDLPENYKNSMEQCADWMESRARQYGDYQIVQDKDFAKLAEEGRAEYESATPAGRPLNARVPQLGFSQMTDFEQDIYFALYKKKGLAAADQFYSDIEGSLLARTKENIRAGAEESAQSGFFGRVFNELVSIGMAGVEVPLNIAYLIGSAVEGEGSKWLRVPSYAAKTANETVIQELHQIYEGTVWDKVFPTIAEILNNRGRSYTTGYLFGRLIPESAGDVIHAFPIATIAFGEAYEEAVDNGLKPWQAWTLGAINFACESVTEGIKYGHYESLFDGNTITLATFKEYFMDKVSQLEWLSEATGETLNNILERAANRYFAGDKSEHNKRVNQYIDSGLCSSVKEAEAMVAADYVREDIHTAITSALSDFLDVGMFAAGKLSSTIHYATELQSYRKNVDANATIQTLRDRDAQLIRNAEQLQKNMEAIRAEMIEKANQPFNPKNPAEVSEAARQSNQNEYDVDMTILENSADSDQGTVTETIAAVMRVSGQNTNRANAAAVAFVSRNGQNAINELSNMLDAGRKAGTNINTLKLGIQYALLGNGACNQVINSEAYQNATPEQQAEMLSMATQEDANNQEVQAAVNAAVHENRVAEAEKDIFSEDGAKEIEAFQEAADEADMEAYVAQEEYSDRLDARKEAADNMTTVTMDFLADNSTENQRRKERAENELTAADAVAKEYEQHLRKAQEKQQKTSQALEQTKDEVMARVRQQAEERVAAEEAAEAKVEAEAAQQKAEADRIAEEEQAEANRQQKIADQRSGKTAEESARAKIQRLAEAKGYTGEQAEQFVNDVMNYWQTGQVNKIDLSKQFSKSEGYLMMGALSRRFGVNVDITDIASGENGYYNPNTNTITLNKNLPAGQVLVEFALHELTHSLENTGAYQQYHDTVLNILYPSEAELNDAVAKKMADYEDEGHSINETQAKNELVAEFTRLRLNDKAMVQRMVDAGLGGRIRNALHNVNQFLKNTRLTGEARTEAENLRRTERMFQKAIRERSRAQAKARTEAIKQANTPAAKLERSATPVVSNAQGDAEVSEVRGGTISRTDGDTEYSVASWTDEEKQRVRDQLKDRMMSENDGSMTEEEMDAKIDKWINDVNDIAYIIANDRNRLDYTADPEKTMLKPNAEYVKTLDASTLCAKRLLYQGTFDAIQHQLPNTPLMPADLIDLANMMRDMGYEAPCGICYVESRRRQLGKFTEQWLESYEGEYKPTLDEVTTSDGLERLRSAHPQAYQDFISAMNKKGTMNPKVVQLRTDYRGEISQMTPAQVQKVKDIGGLRVQSFSDFETPHLIDMMQAVMDMSSQKLTAQAYTKVPNFPWVFGDTGIKINLSLIGKGTGLDENGNLLFDDVEGMPFEEAMKLRDRYSNNVGTILVGINDQHILAAMADDRIDFIIPFHKSGWSKEELTKMPVLNGYSDYTDSQNEKAIVGRDKNGKYKTESLDKSKRVNFQPVGENGYWDFSKSGKENAEVYLRKCAEDGRLPKFSQFLVDNGDGSFSLQPDGSTDGYWKTLIDFKMYDNEGNGAPQQEVNPDFNMDEARRVLDEYSLERNGVSRESNNDLPVAQEVVDAYVQKYMDEHPGREYSAGMSKMTDAQKAQALQEANVDYQDAVARGDMEAAQEDVDFYAEQKGYTFRAYHGTLNSFNQFDERMTRSSNYWGNGFYFTDNAEEATNVYSNKNSRENKSKNANGENPNVINALLRINNPAVAGGQNETFFTFGGTDLIINALNNAYHEMYSADQIAIIEENGVADNFEWLSDFYPDGVGLSDLRNEMNTLGMYGADGIQILNNALRTLGYDGIIAYPDGQSEFNNTYGSTHYVLFNSNDVKSADAVTYDDNGNVIPLDQRFSDSNDIRYSVESNQMTDAERSQALVDAGIISQEELNAEQKTNTEQVPVHTPGKVWNAEGEYETKYTIRKSSTGNSSTLSFEYQPNDSVTNALREIGMIPDKYWNGQWYWHGNKVRVTEQQIEDAIRKGNEEFIEQMRQNGKFNVSQPVTAQGGDMSPTIAGPINMNGNGEQTGYRQFNRITSQQSDALHQKVKDHLYKNSMYTKDTNQAQVNRAIDWVLSLASENDPDGYHAAVDAVTSPDFDYLSADGQAKMIVTMAMAATNNNPNLEMRIADAYGQQGTDIARMLQARKIFRLMTPIGRRMALESMASRINQQYKNENKDIEVHLSDWTLEAAAVAETEEDFEKVQRAAEAELAAQMPATWQDKLRTWRMLSMLANPRTHIRNIIGNALFMPVVSIKNAIGEQLENIAAEKGVYGYDLGERTKARKYSQDAIDFASKDVEAMKDTLTGEAKFGAEDRIKQNQKAFGQGKGILSRTIGQAVQLVSDFNSSALEWEDWQFLNRHYRNALASYMTANNLTSEQMTGETLTKARAYAVEEAQKATYRDANAISSKLNQWSRDAGLGGFVVDAVIPFKKTPANILRRGIEYSPVGLIKSWATAKKSLELYNAWEKNGKKGEMPKGAKSANQVLDSIASGLTGTAITALGAMLYAAGAVRLKLNDEDDELKKEKGSQEYSLELFGVSVTLDWAAPVCMPFFTGAATCKTVFDQYGEDFNISALADAIFQMADPVFNLSMLDGISSLLRMTSNSNDQNPIGLLAQKIGSNFLGSLVPSFAGAVARTVDTTRRKNYTKSGSTVWDSLLEQVENKIPFLSRQNIPYRNVWGEPEESSRFEAFMENFISPGYFNRITEDDLTDELQRIYDSTGDKSVIPTYAEKTLSVNGKNVKLNDKQYDDYSVARGQTAKELLNELIKRPEFIALAESNPEAQVQLVKDVWSYAKQVGKHEVFPETEFSEKWMQSAYNEGNVIDKIFAREEEKAKNADADDHMKGLYSCIDHESADGLQAHVEGLKRSGRTEKSIRQSLMRHYGDMYKEAVISGNDEYKDAIKYGMQLLDLGDYSFDDSTFDKWETDAWSKHEETIETTQTDTTGRYGKGNIDLNNRKVVSNPDGSISTEQSFSFYDEDTGKEILVPTVINGRIVSEDEAIDHYYATGEYLGMFDTPEEATEYAEMLHNRQDWYYNR